MKNSFRTTGRSIAFCYQHLLGLYIAFVLILQIGVSIDYRFGIRIAPTLDIVMILSVLPILLFTRSKWVDFLKSPFMVWFFFTALVFSFGLFRLHFGEMNVTQDDIAYESQLAQKLIILGACAYCIYAIDIRYFTAGLYLVLVLLPSLVVLDFFVPDLLNPPSEQASARATGTYRNPNVASEAIILIVLLNLARLRGIASLFLALLVSVAVIVTFSRAGLVASMILFGYMIWRNKLSRMYIVVPVLFFIYLGSILIVAEDTLESLGYSQSSENVLNRLQYFSNIETSNLVEEANSESRTEIAVIAFKDSFLHPIIGHGFGSYVQYEVSPHNLPVHLMYKYGFFGLLIWVGLAYGIYRKGTSEGHSFLNPALLIFLWFCFFSHNQLDERTWAVFFAFVLLKSPSDWHGALSGTHVRRKRENYPVDFVSTTRRSGKRRPSSRSRRFRF